MTKRVLILHPWLPDYRERFFLDVIESLANSGIELHIAHGTAPPDVEARGDAIERDWARPVNTRYVTVGRRTVAYRSLPRDRTYDLVILEQAIRNVENYLAMAGGIAGKRTALWGHGRTYTKPQTRVEEGLKLWMTKRASWFFAYTQGGADYLTRHGYPSSRLTVVQNSIDTRELAEAHQHVTEGEVVALREHLNLGSSPTALFVGGLDASKRLDFMLAAGAEIAAKLPNFALVVAGDGSQRQMITSRLGELPWLRYAGPVRGAKEKAVLAATARVFLMPGRIGLVAVDSFALRVPIVTTDWRYHAPEFEYLEHGRNAWVTDDNVDAYVQGAIRMLCDEGLIETLGRGCLADSKRVTLEEMVRRFHAGVVKAIDD